MTRKQKSGFWAWLLAFFHDLIASHPQQRSQPQRQAPVRDNRTGRWLSDPEEEDEDPDEESVDGGKFQTSAEKY